MGRLFITLLSVLALLDVSVAYEDQHLAPGTVTLEESLRHRRAIESKEDKQKKGFTQEEKQFLVDKHNEYRRIPNAADMLYMSWDNELENLAQKHANKCVWDHNKERTIPSTQKRAGENLHVKSPKYNVETMMSSWYSEEEFYTYNTGSCKSGEQCGHYTQVIWAKSEAVGCGIRYCASVEGLSFGNAYVTVCNYRPAGNVAGSKPYTKGSSCSQCPDGKKTCDKGLCRDGSGQAASTKAPVPTTTQEASTTVSSASSPTKLSYSLLISTVTILIHSVEH